MTLIRIQDLKVQKYGNRGLSVSLSRIFSEPRNIEKGDVLPAFLSKINNVDCLVIASKEIPDVSNVNIITPELKQD